MNPFLPSWAASRYAEHRPRIHAGMLRPVQARYASRRPAALALDLGCGTGLSSLALADLARLVTAADSSPEMLRAAGSHPRVRYVRARAEALPFPSGAFDLATLGCTLHWCEPEATFEELRRVLQEDGLLVPYDNAFFGEMRESRRATKWLQTDYRERFPAPPRVPFFRPEHAPAGFRVGFSDFVEAWVPFTCAELVGYLTTQSNVIDAVESGRETLAGVERALRGALEPCFQAVGSPTAHFRFGGRVSVLHREGAR